MNKKIYTILFLIVVLFLGGYYYFYFQNSEVKTQDDQNEVVQEEQNGEVEVSGGGECPIGVNRIIDGAFQKTEDGFIYLQIEGQDSVEMIKVTDDTSFLKIDLTSSMDVIDQSNITVDELGEGNQLSVISLCNECAENEEGCIEEKTALTVRYMNVEGERE